ncbi:Puromycin-sensitive aminopeptidase [Halotydeus destructor]|nr:Puromycin-sensitive aminopeptidase [Halotydeus destructor]
MASLLLFSLLLAFESDFTYSNHLRTYQRDQKRLSSRMSSPKKPFQRLPSTVVPKHYAITLQPNLKTFRFDGHQTVDIEIEEETDIIVLNQVDLSISEANYTNSKGEAVSSSVIVDNEDEIATIKFENALKPGSGVLHLSFTGILNENMKGLYRSKYSVGGETRYAAVTQFAPTDARRAFPCWDEPALKATFDISLVVPKELVALSNMNEISNVPYGTNSDLKIVSFATTPVMSTYLVACAVGEFDYVESEDTDGIAVRVFTPLGKKDQGQFALEVACKTLPYYKEYFKIAYPLPKMDLIALADLSFGAMENWGLVTYRETCLLVDPLNTSAGSKQRIALVVGHELAHQWFGNLVTMEWWTHLWLNEGYASFVEYMCVDKLFPEYDIWTQFISLRYTKALELDGLHNSHPIEITVGHPSEVNEIFDDISYAKGASVIRMLHRFLSDEHFREGMSLYLERHKYANAQTDDLWNALEESSLKPVRSVMSSWTKQKGFPVLTVSQRHDGDTRILTVSQEKFCSDGKLPEAETTTLWMIPVTICTTKSPDSSVLDILVSGKVAEVVVPDVGPDDFVKLNQGTVGVYRVQYSDEMLSQLLPAIENKSLSSVDRLGIENDMFALVQAGRLPTVDILKLFNAYVAEDHYTVWSSIDAALGKLNRLISHTDFQDRFHIFGRRLLSTIHDKLGWEPVVGESHTDGLLRSLVLSRLSSFSDPQVIQEAKRRFEQHVSVEKVLPADLRQAVYGAVAQDADDRTFDALFRLYRESDLHEEKERIGQALGSVSDVLKIEKVLDFALSDEVRSQDTVSLVIAVAMTTNGRELAWNFFRKNKGIFQQRYRAYLITRLVKYLTENFASEDRALEVEAFFAGNPFPGTERTVQQSLETIRLHSDWLSRETSNLKAYITEANS